MKKFFVSVFAALISMSAFAGTPTAVKDAYGAKVYPTEPLLRIEKDTNSGNRVKALYATGAVKYIDDNASWSAHAKLVAGMTKPVVSPAVGNGLVFDTAKGFVECTASGTAVSWATNYNTETVADNCALDTAWKQIAN